MVKSPRSAKKAFGHSLFTSFHPVAQGCQHTFRPYRCFHPIPSNRATGFCLLFSRFGTNEAKLNSNCIGIDISHPTFLPPFPRLGFANQDFQ